MGAVSNLPARAVALAVRALGTKRGCHLAAQQLGVAERTARAIHHGETSGASVCPDAALAALIAFQHIRAGQLRRELEELRADEALLAARGAAPDGLRNRLPLGGGVVRGAV